MPSAHTGRIALVTGGSRGIGAAVCRSLAAAGVTVVATYVTGKDEANALVTEGGRRKQP